MSQHRLSRHRRRLIMSVPAAVGMVALGVSMVASSAGAVAQSQPSGRATSPTADPPPRVTAISNVLDLSQTGSTLGLPLGYNVGTGAVNLAMSRLPPEVQPVLGQVLLAEAAGPQVFEAMAPYATQFIDGSRAAVAPLAPYNDQLDSGLTSMADGARAVGKALGPVIQPADASMYQFADYLESLRAK